MSAPTGFRPEIELQWRGNWHSISILGTAESRSISGHDSIDFWPNCGRDRSRLQRWPNRDRILAAIRLEFDRILVASGRATGDYNFGQFQSDSSRNLAKSRPLVAEPLAAAISANSDRISAEIWS